MSNFDHPPAETKRTYRSFKRAASASATRSRVIAAASALFAQQGYAATTMQQIADAAAVSVETVYANGPKRALIVAAFEVAFAGDEGRQPLAERPEAAALLEVDDREQLLQGGIRFVAAANERSAGIWRAFRAAANGDAEVREVMDDLVERRTRDYALIVGALTRTGSMPGEPREHAVSLTLLLSNESWEHLVELGGWSGEEWVGWVVRAIKRLILEEPC